MRSFQTAEARIRECSGDYTQSYFYPEVRGETLSPGIFTKIPEAFAEENIRADKNKTKKSRRIPGLKKIFDFFETEFSFRTLYE